MPIIIVEREFQEPRDAAELQAREDRVSWCLEQHEVRFRHSYFARDRKRMVCFYEARDAESVRTTQRTAELPFTRIRPATDVLAAIGQSRPPLAEGKVAVVVEREFPEPRDVKAMIDAAMTGIGCFQVNQVDILESFLALDGHSSLCMFGAFDAESVRKANRTLDSPFERAWSADLIVAAE